MPKKNKIGPKADARGNGVDLKEVESLLDFMQQHGLEEFEYERNGLRIRLKKPSAASPSAFRPLPISDLMVSGPHAAAGTGSAGTGGTGTGAPGGSRDVLSEAGRSEDLHVVKSPIVGTFYAAASPGSQSFTTVGAHVEAGQVLCIIEAMKLMNEIESDVAGDVVRIFVENGQPVEYGEPLFGIHPHRKK
jgi:acetyl-CoA carboxylase biotin carboxyl carrier protein